MVRPHTHASETLTLAVTLPHGRRATSTRSRSPQQRPAQFHDGSHILDSKLATLIGAPYASGAKKAKHVAKR